MFFAFVFFLYNSHGFREENLRLLCRLYSKIKGRSRKVPRKAWGKVICIKPRIYIRRFARTRVNVRVCNENETRQGRFLFVVSTK